MVIKPPQKWSRCTTPITWDSTVDHFIEGPQMLQVMEQIIREVQKNLKVGQDLQKSYANSKR